MKNIIYILITLIIITIDIQAEEKVLLNQDFENQIPGSIPSGWKYSWGNRDEDLFMISSEYAANGKKCMIFDRTSKESHNQWGFVKGYPVVKDGMIKVDFNLMIEGPGNQACFSFEFRDATMRNRLFSISFKDRKIFLNSNAKLPRKEKVKTLGTYDPHKWYSFSLYYPADCRKEEQVTVTCHPAGSKDKAVTVKNLMAAREKNPGFIMACIMPNKNGYRFFLDDLRITHHNGKMTTAKK